MNKIRSLIFELKLWFISSKTAHCDCIWTGFTRSYWRPASLLQVDMHNVTVDGIEALECSVCKCKLILSKYGVARCSTRKF